MTSLTDQAEQALLGALLADDLPPLELSFLRADDFDSRIHGHLYTVVTELRQYWPDLTGDALINSVAVRADTPSVDVMWLTAVRDDCPQPDHVAAYARMVQSAAFRRTVADHADRIATAAAHTTDVDGHTHLQKLADALARQAHVYAAFQTIDQADPVHEAQVDHRRVEMEEDLLADLLQHPEQAAELAVFLHSSNFTSPQRQEVFETIVRLGYDNTPIDEVIVSWEMAAIRAITPDHLATTSTEPDAALLHRLAATRTVRSAIDIGRDLLADDLRASLAARLDTLAPQAQRTNGHSPGLQTELRQPPAALNGNQQAPRIDG
jgi:replicative DNA helicase